MKAAGQAGGPKEVDFSLPPGDPMTVFETQ